MLTSRRLGTSTTGGAGTALTALTTIAQQQATGAAGAANAPGKTRTAQTAITNPASIATKATGDGIAAIAVNDACVAAIDGCRCSINAIGEQIATRGGFKTTNLLLAWQVD